METPHEVFRQLIADSGDYVAAIRTVRQRFGLSLVQAKEVMLQEEGKAKSLDEFQERLADELEREIWKRENRS